MTLSCDQRLAKLPGPLWYGGEPYVNRYPQEYRWLRAVNQPGNNIGGVGWANGICIVYRGRSLGTINFFNHDGSALY